MFWPLISVIFYGIVIILSNSIGVLGEHSSGFFLCLKKEKKVMIKYLIIISFLFKKFVLKSCKCSVYEFLVKEASSLFSKCVILFKFLPQIYKISVKGLCCAFIIFTVCCSNNSCITIFGLFMLNSISFTGTRSKILHYRLKFISL